MNITITAAFSELAPLIKAQCAEKNYVILASYGKKGELLRIRRRSEDGRGGWREVGAVKSVKVCRCYTCCLEGLDDRSTWLPFRILVQKGPSMHGFGVKIWGRFVSAPSPKLSIAGGQPPCSTNAKYRTYDSRKSKKGIRKGCYLDGCNKYPKFWDLVCCLSIVFVNTLLIVRIGELSNDNQAARRIYSRES